MHNETEYTTAMLDLATPFLDNSVRIRYVVRQFARSDSVVKPHVPRHACLPFHRPQRRLSLHSHGVALQPASEQIHCKANATPKGQVHFSSPSQREGFTVFCIVEDDTSTALTAV